ncbi:MAG: hypothetical protein COB76_03000 [Alphaproteobacteria bacterium]|nr:MAG: hypothetical protein COB76_03000 [Alphaproteobacteria bacterium]
MVKPELSAESNNNTQAIWAVFCDETDIGFLKILKRGFRHCFLILKTSDHWVIVDPRANKIDVEVLKYPPHFNLPRFFSNDGKTVVKVQGIKTAKKIAPIFPMSCVETVKRVIGLHNRWAITPYQLYRVLTKKKKG